MRRLWVAVALVVAFLFLAQAWLLPGLVVAPGPEESPTPTATVASVPSPTATASQAPSPSPIVSPPTQPTSTPQPSPTSVVAKPSPEEMLEAIVAAELPGRDIHELATRLNSQPGVDIPRVLNTPQPNYEIGHKDTFYINDQLARSYFTVTATIQWVTPHAYFYVQDGATVSLNQLKQAGEVFENVIYPTVHRYFGTEWIPGIDNDPRITILNTRTPGAGGYYSSADEYPRQVHPFSNEREIIYVDIGSLTSGGSSYYATLAHELQHMVHWNMRPREDAWINEGAAELAMRLTGHATSGVQYSFLANPDTQLNDWAEDPSDAMAHYAAAYLFVSYLAEKGGGYESIKEILAQDGNGLERIDRYLRGKNLSYDQLFSDWVVANLLDDPSADGGRYWYKDIDARITTVQRESRLGQQAGTVHQYAADYLELKPPTADFVVEFDGAETVKVVPNDAHSGEMQWWSNRGDVMDASLTRRFDLSKVQEATLQFSTWFDIEEGFDFAYVMVSDDDGRTWKTMKGQFTTSDNPLGTNLGHGYTGVSGGGEQPRWIKEQIDLSPYAGRQILVRFEYITDDVYTGNGFGVDDISIPEIGFVDTVEEASQWEAKGFVRLRNIIPQRFAVRLVTKSGGYTVQDMPLDAENRGQITIRGLGQEVKEAFLVIAAMSPGTTEQAAYTYRLQPLSSN